jgi:hypothetical protein
VGFYNMPSKQDIDVKVDDTLREFLSKGKAPIYIGFGSIVVKKPEELTSRLLYLQN